MKMEWWMLDGGICLIILFSAILGAAKGLGDTVLRILGIGGGIALGMFYSGEVTKYLESTPFRVKVYNKVFELLRDEHRPIDTIAGFCGFSTEVALRKAFRLRMGKSMSEWRKQARLNG